MAHASRMAAGQESATQAADPVAVVDNPQGRSPILLICEHASNRLPSRYGTLGLAPSDLESHIAWDPGALGVAQELSRLLDAPLIHASVSRLVLDLNREPSAPDSICTLSERTTIVLRRGREMQLTVDGSSKSVWVTATSVDEALGQIGLRAAGAVLSADRSRAIPLKGFSLDVRTRKTVQLLDSGRVRRISTNALTVQQALHDAKVTLRHADRLSVLSSALLKTLAMPDIVRKLEDKAITIKATRPEELQDYIESETRKWRGVIETAGIKPE